MITAEMLKEAFKTSHDACKGEKGCIHADAFSHTGTELDQMLKIARSSPFSIIDPGLPEFYAGVHVGYRLAQLEAQGPAPKINPSDPKVN